MRAAAAMMQVWLSEALDAAEMMLDRIGREAAEADYAAIVGAAVGAGSMFGVDAAIPRGSGTVFDEELPYPSDLRKRVTVLDHPLVPGCPHPGAVGGLAYAAVDAVIIGETKQFEGQGGYLAADEKLTANIVGQLAALGEPQSRGPPVSAVSLALSPFVLSCDGELLCLQGSKAPVPVNQSTAVVVGAILELFRAEYRRVWNLPFTREVLAHVSNVMVAAPPELCPDFDFTSQAAERQRSPLVLSLARRVFQEYQLQLVNPGELEPVSAEAGVPFADGDAVWVGSPPHKPVSPNVMTLDGSLHSGPIGYADLDEGAPDDSEVEQNPFVFSSPSTDVHELEPKFKESFHLHRCVPGEVLIGCVCIKLAQSHEHCGYRWGTVGMICADFLGNKVSSDGTLYPVRDAVASPVYRAHVNSLV